VAKTPDVGQVAPDFTLPGVLLADGEAAQGLYTLSQQRGHPVVLAFYPGDNTAVCTRQLCSYTSGLESFTGFGAIVWAISPQGLASHEQFARKYNLAFPLLADDGLSVSKQYGITLGAAGLRRSVFVIDSGGVLRWKHVTLVGLTFPSADTISGRLSALGAVSA
jgi:thioredoxin-dependent peroxiredoxin